MADLEDKVVFTVDTGNAEKSVKGLKAEIAALKDTILNLEKGSEEYNAAVAKLQADQRQLNEVMSLTKKEAVALEGSYDALVHQMSLLKKEWRSTNDEVKRNELGQQIEQINAQLKEFDSSIGNFQRNVGNYPEDMGIATEATRDFGAEMRNAMETIEPTKQKFESVKKVATGVASGFAAVQGAAALLNIESEDLEKTLVKVNAAMAMAQGVGGIGDLIEGAGKAKVAFAGVGKEIKAVSAAMGKAGWIGLILTAITLVATLTARMVKNNRELKDGTKALRDYREAGDKVAATHSDQIAALKLYDKIAQDVNATEADRTMAATKLLTSLKEEVNETNILKAKNGEYADAIKNVTNKLIEQARVKAGLEMLSEKQKEIIEQQIKIDNRLNNPTGWQKFWDKAKASYVNAMVAGSGIETELTVKASDFAEQRANKMKKRLDQMKTDFNVYLNQITQNSGQDIFGDDSNKIDYAGLANKEIAELDKVYAKRKANALASTQSEKERAEIEYKYETELSQKKLAVYQNYYKQAQGAGDKYKDVAIEFSNQIASIETGNIQRTMGEKDRLRALDLEEQKRYFTTIDNETTNHYDREKILIENSIHNSGERALKLSELEVERLNADKTNKEQYLEWLLQDEEKNKDEILNVKQQLSQQEIKILDESLKQQELKRSEHIKKLYRQIDELTRGYETQEMSYENTGVQQQANTFIETLLGSQQKYREFVEQVFQEEQEGFDRKVTHLEEVKAKLTEVLNNTTDEDERYSIQQEIADTEVEIEQTKADKLKAIRDKDFTDEEAKQNAKVELLHAGLQATSSVLNSIADMYEADGEVSEKEAKKIKALRIASATIDMLQGAITAYSSAQTLPVPFGPIVGGINAAAVIAMGTANIAKIKNTDFTSGNAAAATTPAVPQTSTYQTELPFTYSRTVTGAKETEQLNQQQNIRVWISEHDLTEASHRVEVRQNESSF